MTLPDFLVVGGQKCGSTSFARQLAEHPEIFMSPTKEPNFFSFEEQWRQGLGWYTSLFEGAAAAKAVGEASTTYTWHPTHPGVPARIADLLPNARFLYLVRNPVDRAVSHYLHIWYDRRTSEPFEKAVESIPRLIDYGRYYWQIEQYLPYFSPERWLVLVFEDFIGDPLRVHRQVFRWLKVDPHFVPSDLSPANVTSDKGRTPGAVRWALDCRPVRRIGATLLPLRVRNWLRGMGPQQEKPQVSAALRRRLWERFLPDVEALSRFVGRDLQAVWQMGDY